MQDTLSPDKQKLRAHYLAIREKMDRHEANAAAMALTDHLLKAIPASARVVAAYRPIRGEIDLAGALPELVVLGHQLCLPVVEKQDAPLVFRAWEPGQPLSKGAYGVEVPADKAPLVTPDVIIVPLLAFDTAGHRLGYGAGYYDRTIAQLRAGGKVRTIGAAFSAQQTDRIPAGEQDEKLDAVVTEKGIVTFS